VALRGASSNGYSGAVKSGMARVWSSTDILCPDKPSLVILFISQYIILSGPQSTTDDRMENSQFAALGPGMSH